MSEQERERWEERYASGDYRPRAQPSAFLEESLDVVPPGRALVLACGSGRNAVRLAEAGFDTEAVDISPTAISRARAEAEARDLDVLWRVVDLDTYVIEPGAYDLVTMIRYVNRSLWSRVPDGLAGNGWLLTEQHLQTVRPVVGPSDESFRVMPGELLAAFSHLRVIRYAEVVEHHDRPGDEAALARLLACKGDPGW